MNNFFIKHKKLIIVIVVIVTIAIWSSVFSFSKKKIEGMNNNYDNIKNELDKLSTIYQQLKFETAAESNHIKIHTDYILNNAEKLSKDTSKLTHVTIGDTQNESNNKIPKII